MKFKTESRKIWKKDDGDDNKDEYEDGSYEYYGE